MPSVVRQIHHTIPLLKEKEKEESLHRNFWHAWSMLRNLTAVHPPVTVTHLDYVLPSVILRILCQCLKKKHLSVKCLIQFKIIIMDEKSVIRNCKFSDRACFKTWSQRPFSLSLFLKPYLELLRMVFQLIFMFF